MADWNWAQLLVAFGLGLLSLGLAGGIFKLKEGSRKKAFLWGSVVAVAGGVGLAGVSSVWSGWLGIVTPLAIGGSGSNAGGVVSFSSGVSAPLNNCPDTRVSTARIALKDEFATTNTYLSGSTIYLFTKNNGNMARLSATSGNTGYDANATLDCPKDYNIVAVSQAGIVGSAEIVNKVTNRQSEFIELVAPAISPLQLRIKDTSTDLFQTLFRNGNSDMDTENTTSYTTLNYTHAFADASGKNNNITVGTDGFSDLNVYIKTVDARQTAGEHLPFYTCVDLNWNSSSTTNWQEPSVSYEGVTLSDAKGGLDADSVSGAFVSDSEYCYKLVDDGVRVDDKEKLLRLRFTAKAGSDPTPSTANVALSFLPVGKYYSFRNPNVIKTGIYNDNSTRFLTQVASDRTPVLVVHFD